MPDRHAIGQTAAQVVLLCVDSMVYTVIPDIHADPVRLQRSIAAVPSDGRVAFLGDFIDAGAAVATPDDAAVLKRARGLVASGRAVAVMGNHELNAVLFHRTGADGAPLRVRDAKNRAQHRSFCGSFGTGTPQALDWTRWFLTLPLWLDLGGLRLVHACWDSAAIGVVAARRADGRLTQDDLAEVAARQTAFAKAVNLLLTGPEMTLPDGLRVADSAGHLRAEVRLAWWRKDARTWREAVASVPDPQDVPDTPLPFALPDPVGDGSDTPVLCGHYKMSGDPALQSAVAACLDYPAAPCVYLWGGKALLDRKRLLRV